MSRRTLILVTAIFVLGFGAVGVWLVVRNTTRPDGEPSFLDSLPFIGGGLGGTPTPGAGGSDIPSGSPTPIGSGGSETRPVREIVAKDILAPTMGRATSTIYFISRENGHVFSTDLEGANEKKLTNLTIVEAFEAFWSPQKTKAAVFYHDNGTVKKFLNEIASGTPSKFLPPELTSLSWSPDGRELAYLVPQGAATQLVIADANGRSARAIYSTPIPDFTVQWIRRQTILLISRPSALAPSLVLAVNPDTRAVSTLITSREGVVLLGAPGGAAFTFSESSERDGLTPLSLYTLQGGEIKRLDATTIAEKCAFSPSGKKLYCGVPTGSPSGPLPDAWYRGTVSFSDVLVELDLERDTRHEITEPSLRIDVTTPFVSSDGRFLFFKDKSTGHLWRVTVSE